MSDSSCNNSKYFEPVEQWSLKQSAIESSQAARQRNNKPLLETIASLVRPSVLASVPESVLDVFAAEQQSGSGGIVSFEVNGGKEQAWQFIDAIKLFSITANLGDTKSTITHPRTTTHHKLTDEQASEVGIKPGLIRLSVGLEGVSDIIDDLDQAGLNMTK